MPLVIPDEVMNAAGLTGDEAKKELAISLFQQERLTLGQASRFADVSQEQFQAWLAARQIPLHYGIPDFEQDLETLRNLGRY